MGRERRVEGRSGDGAASAGLGSRQAPVGKPRGGVGAIFAATPVPEAPTLTGCPTLSIFFFKHCWVVFRVYYCLAVSCGPKEPRGVHMKVDGTIIMSLLASWPHSAICSCSYS